MEILENISLKNYNTFGIDCKAKFFIKIQKVEELRFLIDNPIFQTNRRFVVSGGSNLLFINDFDGLIILMDIKGIHYEQSNGQKIIVKVAAGEIWSDFVELTVKNRMYGLENLVYIPGKVGAAAVQNIGAYGAEQKDFFLKLEGINLETGYYETIFKKECQFSYRSSIFKNELLDKFIITYVYYELDREWKPNLSYKELKQELEKFSFVAQDAEYVMNTVKLIRMRKLPEPKVLANAGSFFKNPIISQDHLDKIMGDYPDIPYFKSGDFYKIPAAYLIEKCGWKGVRRGNCGVYEKHSLILVNYGNATGDEIFVLSEEIRLSVLDKFGILLEREVIVVE
jgi:UDP-N-acetylmuramate dehydrogenase